MFVCINNGNQTRKAENYDLLIDISNISSNNPKVLNGWVISSKGITHPFSESPNKKAFQENYKKGLNQIICNDSGTNFTMECDTGEILQFVGKNNYIEKEL